MTTRCSPLRKIRLYAVLLLLLGPSSGWAAVWQWSVPIPSLEGRRAYLWIPPDCPHLRGLAGWPVANVKRAQLWFKEVLYPCVSTGKMRSANWGTSCLAGCMAMAIFCDDRTMFNNTAYAFEHGFTNTTDGGCVEYTAKYNLGYEVPYHPFPDYTGRMIYAEGISPKNRGHFSPIYEMANYYFTKAGFPAPYVKQVAESPGYRPEGTNSDHTGLGTLLYYR